MRGGRCLPKGAQRAGSPVGRPAEVVEYRLVPGAASRYVSLAGRYEGMQERSQRRVLAMAHLWFRERRGDVKTAVGQWRLERRTPTVSS
jgi:hypothetical protein